jgi:uncharacterized membrane protein
VISISNNEFNRLVTIAILTAILLVLINIQTENIVHNSLRSFLSLFFIFFLSGYSLILLISEKDLEPVEVLVFSVIMSICITIIDSMIIHLIGLKINLNNIMNLVASTTLIFIILKVLKDYYFGGRRHEFVWRR